MRRKETKLIITFSSTTQAMAFEDACRERGAPGRLIPVPRSITAGCGLAWCADPSERDALVKLLRESGTEEEALHLCEI